MDASTSPAGYGAVRDRIDPATLIRVGVIAGIAGGMVMAMWQMFVGAIATEQTADPGINSTFWTAVTSIPSVIFGQQWFHGSFEFWAVVIGLMMHMMMSAGIGVLGVGISTSLLGSRPQLVPAVVVGMMWGLILEVVLVNIIVNNWQDVNTLYTSTPEWSWWVAHAMFGATLGLVASTLLRREPSP